MFNLPTPQQQQQGQGPLHALSMSTHTQLLHHQLVSPTSSSGSGASSPNNSPYTPTSTMLTQSFAHLSASDSSSSNAAGPTQAELDLQMEMQLQQEFAAYNWESTSVWPSGTEMLLGDDFDLNSIPPIELGMPKFSAPNVMGLGFGGEGDAAAAEYGQIDGSQHLEGLLEFDEMMTGHGFC